MGLKADQQRAKKLLLKSAGVSAKGPALAFTGKSSKFARRAQEVIDRREEEGSLQLKTSFESRKRPREDEQPGAEKRDRFERVIEKSRQAKAEQYIRRTEVQAQTDTLDDAFNGISHLLKQRDKVAEAETSFKQPKGKETSELWLTQKAQRSSRSFVIHSAVLSKESAPAGLDDDDKRLLASLCVKEVVADTKEEDNQRPADMDDFDKILTGMRLDPSRRAKATIQRRDDDTSELRVLAGAEAPIVAGETVEMSRKDWIASGGDAVYDMHDELDEDVESHVLPMDQFFECFAQLESASRSEDTPNVFRLLQSLRQLVSQSPTQGYAAFRTFLADANASPLAHTQMIIFYAAVQLFPSTEVYHPVLSPLRVLFCRVLSNPSPIAPSLSIVCAALLESSLRGSGLYAPELIVLCANWILKGAESAPKGYAPFAIIESIDKMKIDQFDGVGEPIDVLRLSSSFGALIAAAFSILVSLLRNLSGNAGIGSLEAIEFLSNLQFKEEFTPLAAELRAETSRIVSLERAPLAMRTFRPRPLRQFDPMLAESNEWRSRRELKTELREDRKRVVRQLQAEADVARRHRESEWKADDSRRESKLRTLMGELQHQQHIMKTVDLHRTKAKMKKKKGISGEAAPPSTEETPSGN